MGWQFSPQNSKTNLDPLVESGTFHYKMGTLDRIKLNQLNPSTARSLPRVHKKIKTDSQPIKTVEKLPEIKLVDPKPKISPATKASKKASNPTSDKQKPNTSNQLKASNSPTSDQRQNSYAVNSGNSNGIVNAANQVTADSNGMVASGILTDSRSGANPSSPQASDSDAPTLSEEKWTQFVLQNPNFETGKQFFNAYVAGDVSQVTYFNTTLNLIFDPASNRKQVGIYLLSLEVSPKAFATIHNVIEREPSLQPSLDLLLSSYHSESGVSKLIPLLTINQSPSLMNFTLRQIEVAVSLGSLNRSSLNPSSSNSRRGESWGRLSTSPQNNVSNRLLAALNRLTESLNLDSDSLQLVQSLELRLNDSRVVAID